MPESRVLFGITVDDLVDPKGELEGRYALEAEGRDLLVEHVMKVGANLLDAEDFPAGPEYFGPAAGQEGCYRQGNPPVPTSSGPP